MGASTARVEEGTPVRTEGFKQKLMHEAGEFPGVFLFLVPLVISPAIYQSYLLRGAATLLFVAACETT